MHVTEKKPSYEATCPVEILAMCVPLVRWTWIGVSGYLRMSVNLGFSGEGPHLALDSWPPCATRAMQT